jgi:FAD:protein FMN transferase
MLAPLCALLLAAVAAPPPAAPAERLSAPAFGDALTVETRGLSPEAARGALQAALDEAAALERLVDPERPESGVGALNAAAGRGPQPVDPRLLTLLGRALDFCSWSERAHGPLGRSLYRLWDLRSVPAPERLQQAAALTGCDRLTLDAGKRTAALAAGSGLDLRGFVEGYAVDRAVEVLRQHGARDGYVRLGGIHRGFGAGPAGKGWPVQLPALSGDERIPGRVYLRDRSLAVVVPADRPLRIGDETFSPYLNQRTGQPTQGVMATLAFTDLALDARGLAVALLITGPREGELRLGSLRPSPAVLWLMGTGTGPPLVVEYRWSEVPKR